MTIDEALHRVVRQHWLLILACVILPTVASWVLSSRSADLYAAVARVQLGRDLAASNVQADAMSQRALGIATSPGVVSLALQKAGLREDAASFAANHVDVQRVGVSPVVEISVTDQSPKRAAIMASSITADVLQFSNLGDRQAADQRQAELKKQISALTEERQGLIPRLKSASPGDVLAIEAQLAGLLASQTEYERQLSELDLAAASAANAVLLDPVRVPIVPLPSDAVQRAVLAALIGILLGLGLAAAREAVWPRLATPRAIADALGTIHVGDIPSRDLSARPSAAALSAIADRLALLGLRHDTERVLLGTVNDRDDVLADLIAQLLATAGPRANHHLDYAVLDKGWVDPGRHPAAVVLAPRRIRARQLRPLAQLLQSLGWPLLGLVTYAPQRRMPLGRRTAPRTERVPAGAVGRP